MCFRVLISAFCIVFTSCVPRSDSYTIENNVLRELVALRTKGLLMNETIRKHNKYTNVLALSRKVTSYYEITQPNFLAVCKGKDLQLSASQFDTLSYLVERDFNGLSATASLQSYEDHINTCIQIYSRIIQEGKTDELSYFSFIALPGLLNLKEEITAFKDSNMFVILN